MIARDTLTLIMAAVLMTGFLLITNSIAAGITAVQSGEVLQ